jgi:hypothetical protein
MLRKPLPGFLRLSPLVAASIQPPDTS